jgi:hypothetical protein
MQEVRDFAGRLRDHGIEVILDQLANEEQFNHGGPPEGWEHWSYDQVDLADKVLMIGSPEYFRVYENKERPGKGIGAAIEAQRIFTQLCQQKGLNSRFRIAFLSDADECDVPDQLHGYHRFYINKSPEHFTDAVTWIKGRSAAKEAQPVVINWPAAASGYGPDLANRQNEFRLFADLIAGQTVERALFLEAPSSYGKTLLLAECIKYAAQQLGTGVVKIDFKGNATRDFVLDTLRLELGNHLPTFRQPQSKVYDLRLDLRNLASPILLAFDTYERANSEARELVEGLLLADIDRLGGVRIIIAGQDVPDHEHALWSASVRHFNLEPITETKCWQDYAERHHMNVKAQHVEALTLGSAGIPGVIRSMLQTLAAALEVE